MEVFSAYPSGVVGIFAVEGVDEEGGAHPVDVVDVDVLILVLDEGSVSDGTAAAEEVDKMGALGQEAHDALSELVLGAFVWESVVHWVFFLRVRGGERKREGGRGSERKQEEERGSKRRGEAETLHRLDLFPPVGMRKPVRLWEKKRMPR